MYISFRPEVTFTSVEMAEQFLREFAGSIGASDYLEMQKAVENCKKKQAGFELLKKVRLSPHDPTDDSNDDSNDHDCLLVLVDIFSMAGIDFSALTTIEKIKAFRALSGLGLKESKDYIYKVYQL